MPVIKHNTLIETSYKLNSREQFFVLYLIAQISQQDDSFKEYTMHYSDIERILNFDGKRRIANKSEVFSLMDKLNSVPILYERGRIVGKSVWLQYLEHNQDTDEFTFGLSEKLHDYLLQLKEHFTKYNLINVAYLNSNAIRLYELLKRHQFKGNCEFTIEKIKFYLGLEGRYPKFYDFKRWVLVPAQKEITKYTDIRFEYQAAKKRGKKILSLRFLIYENKPEYTPEIKYIFKELDSVGPGIDSAKANAQDFADLMDRKGDKFTRAQLLALHFLTSKGVNQKFIEENILQHEKVKYEPLLGFEDIYAKSLWRYFDSKSKASKKAGAFVNWWKKGKLTTDNLHARMIEAVRAKAKTLTPEEQENRINARKFPANVYEVQKTNLKKEKNKAAKQQIAIPFTKPKPEKKASVKRKNWGQFNYEWFKREHSERYQSLLNTVVDEYKETFRKANQSFDLEKYRSAIDSRVEAKCKAWWKGNE